MVLTNAIYFKGDWNSEFDSSKSRLRPFHLSGKEHIEVPTMYQMMQLSYFENSNLQMVALPYKGRHLSMIIVLPRTADGLAALEETLTLERFREWVEQMRPWNRVEVWLPKFELQWSLPLGASLKSLGIDLAMGTSADFTGISHDEPLYLSNVLHQAYVDVNEKGTEAAAATSSVIKAVSSRDVPSRIYLFQADHPFLFFIADRRTDTLLFMGRVQNPSQ